MSSETNALIAAKSAAKLLGVSYFALLKKVKQRELPSYAFGRKILVDLQEVKEAIRQKAVKQPNET